MNYAVIILGVASIFLIAAAIFTAVNWRNISVFGSLGTEGKEKIIKSYAVILMLPLLILVYVFLLGDYFINWYHHGGRGLFWSIVGLLAIGAVLFANLRRPNYRLAGRICLWAVIITLPIMTIMILVSGSSGSSETYADDLYPHKEYSLIVFPAAADPGEEQMWSDDIETKLGFRPTFLKPLVDPENPLKIRLVTSVTPKGYIDLYTNDPDFAEKFHNTPAIRVRGHALGKNPVKNYWKYIPE